MTLYLLLMTVLAQGTVDFASVAQGTTSRAQTAQHVVLRTEAAWDALWREQLPTQPRPSVDFDESAVLGVFLGPRPTAGYRAEIRSVTREGDLVVVAYAEHPPPPGTFSAQVVTSPFHLVRVPADVSSVLFRQVE